MKDNNFGIELEFTGITRERTANILARLLNSQVIDISNMYCQMKVVLDKGRTWKIKIDKTIKSEMLLNKHIVDASSNYKVEISSPILQFNEDLDLLKMILNELEKNGAFVNNSCAIHIHVDGRKIHTPKTLCNLLKIIYDMQDDIFKKNELDKNEWKYGIKKLDKEMIDKINNLKYFTFDNIEDIWYFNYPNKRTYFNESRYRLVNFHSFFYGIGTIEFRFFLGTFDYEKIVSYIKFVLNINKLSMNLSDNKIVYE